MRAIMCRQASRYTMVVCRYVSAGGKQEERTICSLMTLPSSSTVRIFCRTLRIVSGGFDRRGACYLCRFMSVCASKQYIDNWRDAYCT